MSGSSGSRSTGKLLEAQRLKMRTEYDLEMMQEMGFCSGIENYSRHLTGRPPGSRPYTLLDFFPTDFLLVVDESHATIPQIGGMYEGDRSRKTVLVEYGFRLPSALDNRPLNFQEFMEMTGPDRLRQRDAGGVRDQEQHRREHRLHPAQARADRRRTSTCPFAVAGERRRTPDAPSSATVRSSRAPISRRRSSMSTRRARRWSSSRSFARPACSIRRSRSGRSRTRSTRRSSSAGSAWRNRSACSSPR